MNETMMRAPTRLPKFLFSKAREGALSGASPSGTSPSGTSPPGAPFPSGASAASPEPVRESTRAPTWPPTPAPIPVAVGAENVGQALSGQKKKLTDILKTKFNIKETPEKKQQVEDILVYQEPVDKEFQEDGDEDILEYLEEQPEQEVVEKEATVIEQVEGEEEEEEYEYKEIDIDQIEVDENEMPEKSGTFMTPSREVIKTKPQILIKKQFDQDLRANLYVPPSECQSLHLRFTEIQSQLMKRLINPIFGLGGWHRAYVDLDAPHEEDYPKSNRQPPKSTLFKRKKPVLTQMGNGEDSSVAGNTRRSAQYLVALKLKKKSIRTKKPLTTRLGAIQGQAEGASELFWKKQNEYWTKRFKWHYRDRDPVSRHELDQDIDHYMASKGQVVAEAEADPVLEGLSQRLEDVQVNAKAQPIFKSPFAQMMGKIKSLNVSVPSRDVLDCDLDEYMAQSGKGAAPAADVPHYQNKVNNYRDKASVDASSLDQDLDAYMAKVAIKQEDTGDNLPIWPGSEVAMDC